MVLMDVTLSYRGMASLLLSCTALELRMVGFACLPSLATIIEGFI